MKTKLLGFILIGLIMFTVQGLGQELEFTLQQTLCPDALDLNRKAYIADVDNDGDLDVMLNKLYLNDGTGYFAPAIPERVVDSYYGVIFGGFNDDEYIDYIDAKSKDIYLNDPNNPGNFIYQSRIPGLVYGVSRDIVAVADFNEDGIDDLAVGVGLKWVYIYINDGEGTFTQTERYLTYAGYIVRAGDLDGDGDFDLVGQTRSGGLFKILENVGLGSFIIRGGFMDYGLGDCVRTLLGDINGDGHLDIVGTNCGNPRGVAFFGDGNFGFVSESIGRVKPRYGPLEELRDFDGDDDLDALTTSVFLNDGNAIFSYAGGSMSNSDGLNAGWGDLDGDGDLDVINAKIGNVYFTSGLDLNEAPVAQCKDITIEVNENCQASITPEDIDNNSYDPDEDEITLSIDNAGPFGAGEHTVKLTVEDPDGESDSCFATVTVVDTTAPAITNLSATPNSLWPANHKMVAVTVSVEASDNCDASPVSKIIAVESNELINGLGDGDTSPDWEITGDLTLNLRAERSGKGNGRIYTITVECSDAVGNTTTGTVTVVVPKNKKK